MSVLALAWWIARKNPVESSILEIARSVGYTKENQPQQLRRYVKYVLKTEYGPEAATAVEESAMALIDETAMLVETPVAPIEDVNIPSPTDWERMVAVYTFPELLSLCDEKMTCCKCRMEGYSSEHKSGPFFEMLGDIKRAKFALDIFMYILSCQYVSIIADRCTTAFKC